MNHLVDPVVAARFWAKVQKTEGCWLWTSYKIRGYGQFAVILNGKRRMSLAHRVCFESLCEEIPRGLYVLHRCDNPSCVRPDHLFLGTQSDNLRDCSAKGRLRNVLMESNRAKTHCPKGHPYSPENTRMVFDKRHGGYARCCIECNRVSARERGRRIRAVKRSSSGAIVVSP